MKDDILYFASFNSHRMEGFTLLKMLTHSLNLEISIRKKELFVCGRKET